MSEGFCPPINVSQIRSLEIARRSRLLLITLAVIAPFATAAQDLSIVDNAAPARFHVDSDSSWLHVFVYRGGLLRGLGHNHVISHTGISGSVTVGRDPLQSQLMLEFKVADLSVDNPELRKLAGPDFPGQIPAKDIAGTKANMLGKKLLQAERFPSIQLRSEQFRGSMPNLEIEASITVRDAEFTVVFPARVEVSGDSFVARGELKLSHAEIGLKPFKAVLGTLRVRDTLLLKYEISGTRPISYSW